MFANQFPNRFRADRSNFVSGGKAQVDVFARSQNSTRTLFGLPPIAATTTTLSPYRHSNKLRLAGL